MKTKVVPLGFFLMFLCSALTIVATPTTPTVRLPLDLVTMNAAYGNNSYFEMTLSDIPVGYDIIDGDGNWDIVYDPITVNTKTTSKYHFLNTLFG